MWASSQESRMWRDCHTPPSYRVTESSLSIKKFGNDVRSEVLDSSAVGESGY